MADRTHRTLLDALGERIAAGELAAGTVLTLAGIEAEYSVSRSVVREAVRVLEAMGLVEPRRRVGVTVRQRIHWHALDPRLIRWRLAGASRNQQIVALTELRLAIEPTAARFAATRAGADEREGILRLARRLDELGQAGAGATDEYLRVDVAFHQEILAASGNLMLAAISEPISEALSGRHALGLTPADPTPESLHDHLATAAAIARGDSAAAESASRSALEGILDEVRRLL
ncbi:FadR/GntR family transcriptional regulator [Homoserinibacter sp. GY 40078]|uniref:FadR/GntR family transcriptional regulator n=1 Tax=Homoserinibacter sp. GY 40078 TaxID=2603275 RepID=UPI0011CB4666|nr:FCD domain-containing protein [Homoserinibacter sp. GY 40078]TXK19525.1 FadR family transcriptional regulator [Homoserinibacter sp. GY 40078]